MKKLMSPILVLCMVCSLWTAMPLTASAATEGYYTYEVSNGEATITDVDTSISGAITIPSKLGGYEVTEIGYEAFRECTNLTRIEIPNSVTIMGDGVFYGCTGLTSVNIPDNVTSIGQLAFYYCTSLTSITIPNRVTSIGVAAFRECTNLTSVTIIDGVTTIGDWAFSWCTGLTSLEIPGSVTAIGRHAFRKCTSLTSVTIIDGVTTIGDYAFSDCTSLTSITIPNSVTSIGDYAFLECRSLTGIKIPDGVTTIGDYTFWQCRSLTSIKLPASVTTIGCKAFHGCRSLTSVEILGSVTTISDYAFYYCESLTSIKLPDSVTTIGDYAFYNCDSLTSVNIGNSVTTIGDYAFDRCYRLNDVYYSGTEQEWKRISIGSDNDSLTNATRHYNCAKKGISLSKTAISAMPRSRQSIFVYRADKVTKFTNVKATSSNPRYVTTSRNGNEIILEFHESGSADITVEATDGSGAKAVCEVTVGGNVEDEDTYLLTRLALSRIVYSDDLKYYEKEPQKNVIEHEEQKANKDETMFYLNEKDVIKRSEFYKQYIYDYKVIKVSKNTKSGFFGAAFESPKGDIIIAYRGTEPSKDFWNDVIKTDGGMLFTILSKQYDDAINLYDDVKDIRPNSNITLTGHSLGGALASYVSALRNVHCDNVNGATNLIYKNDELKGESKYPVNYEGFDKYVFEHWAGHFDVLNALVTSFFGTDFLNYTKYADTNNYTDRSVARIGRHPFPEVELWKDYHRIESIINYNNGRFTLTEKIEQHTAKPYKGDAEFIGTYGDDTYIAVKKPKSLGRRGVVVAYQNEYILAGAGNDNITLGIGHDTLIGNAGNDTLNGGAGNDTYVFGGNFGNDTIIDPSGKDKIKFTDVSLSGINISGNKITCGANSIEISSKSKRTANFTIVDKDNKTKTMEFAKISLFSVEDTNTTKGIQIFGNATVEIYDASENLIETISVNEETETGVEYKDYGMVIVDSQAVGLTLPPNGYIIKVKSDDEVSVWTVSDADNPTVAKQTSAENIDLSDGSQIVINTGEMVAEQISIKIVNGNAESSLYSEAPENFTITADKTEIKVGETVTMSVPEIFADSVVWECSNDNIFITKNEDLSVNIIGYNAGEETVRAYLPNDELYSAEFSIEITEESAPSVVVTLNDEVYDGTEIATDIVIFDVELPDGYDEVVFSTTSPYSQIEDTNEFVVNSVGNHAVNVYGKNSETGAKTKAFNFEFTQDAEAPEILGAENEGVYYADRVIEVLDTALETVCVNGEPVEQETFILSEIGSCTVTATDTAGNTKEVSFEIKAMPDTSKITLADSELISKIRDDFEEVKYSLSEEKMNVMENQISLLEETLNSIVEITSFTAQMQETDALINIKVANAPENSAVFVASYGSAGNLLELQMPALQDEEADATFATADVFKYKAYLWENGTIRPITESKEAFLVNE